MSAPSFPPADLATWRARVLRELGDKPFEKLVTKTLEGVSVEPLYARDPAHPMASRGLPGATPFVRGTNAGRSSWLVTERIVLADPSRANAVAREAVDDGADALLFALDAAGRLGIDRQRDTSRELVGKDGVAVVTESDVTTLLSGIDLSRTRVFFDAGANALPVASLIESALGGVGPRSGLTVFQDPMGALARDGGLPRPFGDLLREASDLRVDMVEPLISSVPYHAAGATAVHELAFSVATAIAQADLGARPTLEVCASSDLFVTIAKVRALRLLFAKVSSALGRASTAPFVLGRTSPRRLAQRDPHTNMVRITTEAFALAVSGVDALVTSPFDEALGQSDSQARRLARHTQLVLREESHIGRVLDPAGGSYYVEALTDDLARKAWDGMRAIEAEGGMLSGLTSGAIPRLVETAREARLAAIAKRRELLIGVNDFALAGERKLTRPPFRSADDRRLAIERAEKAGLVTLPLSPRRESLRVEDLRSFAALGASLAAVSLRLSRGGESEHSMRLDPTRDAQRFEAIRDEADELSSGGTRPRVVLVCLGTPNDYRAREGYARRFFEAGGFAVSSIESPKTMTTQWIATREETSTADVVCLTSSDERYAELGVPAIRTVRSAYSTAQVVIAGRQTALTTTKDAPMEDKPDLEIYLGCEAVGSLASLLQRVRQRRRRAAATTRRLA